MQPLLIIINRQQVQICCKLPDTIIELTIQTNPLIQLQCEPYEVPLIKQWLNDIVDRLDTEYVLYNSVLVRSDELRKF